MTESLNKSSEGDSVSTGFDRKLRVGVLIDGPSTAAWAFEMLAKIQDSDWATVVQIVENQSSNSRRMTGLARWNHIRKRFFYIVFSKLDTKLSRLRDSPLEVKLLTPLFEGCNWLRVKPVQAGFTDRISSDDLEEMSKDEVDVYIRLGFGILKGDVLRAAPLGVWSFHHGDNRINRGLPPGFWEVYDREPVTAVTLQILSEELDGGQVICRSFSKTNSVYVHRSISKLYWKSTILLPRMLERLYRLGSDKFLQEVAACNEEKAYYTRRLYSYPSNWQALLHMVCTVVREIRHKVSEFLFTEQWLLMYRADTSESNRYTMWRYKKIRPPSDRFWADPFVLTVDGEHHVFFEELIYEKNKGTIGHLCIRKDGSVSDAISVMEKPYHLSYPFVFEHGGSYFMIPESAENRSVDLYRCREFPSQWDHVRTLISNIELVDSTVVFYQDRWWLFAGQRDNESMSISEELSIFHTDDLFNGEWTAHPCNPVVSDVRCARPAGAIIQRGGDLYRPSQDCRNAYGGAISMRKIVELTTESYRETPAGRIDPNWDRQLCGIHTINSGDSVTVVDALRRVGKLPRMLLPNEKRRS